MPLIAMSPHLVYTHIRLPGAHTVMQVVHTARDLLGGLGS